MTAATEPTNSITAFEAGNIDAGAFDHEAHVYVGWLYVREFPLGEAISRVTTALRRLTPSLGVPDRCAA